MNRFYVSKDHIKGGWIDICSVDDFHHLVRALRVKKGEELYITDGEGRAYIAIVDSISDACLRLKIKKTLKNEAEKKARKIRIVLGCAVPKYAHFEEVVDKATQLGVDEIIPLLTERTLVKKEIFDKKRERLMRIMNSAAKQSGVLFYPQLRESIYFEDFIKEVVTFDLALLPNLSESPKSIKDVVAGFKGKSILVLIGPEGDFTKEEIKRAFAVGCQGVCLGGSVLRVDTAAVSVLSFLRMFLA